MGARPLHYLLTTALPASLGDDWVEGFARGLGEDQQLYGVGLLGGDSVSTPGPAALSLTAIGEVAAGAEIRRSGAQPGDDVWVSGTIGDAFLGLKVLRGEAIVGVAPATRAALIARFQLPEPRIDTGPAARRDRPCDDRCLGRASRRSRPYLRGLGVCGEARTARVPVFGSGARDPWRASRENAVSLATGGDDYELLFSAARRRSRHHCRCLRLRSGCGLPRSAGSSPARPGTTGRCRRSRGRGRGGRLSPLLTGRQAACNPLLGAAYRVVAQGICFCHVRPPCRPPIGGLRSPHLLVVSVGWLTHTTTSSLPAACWRWSMAVVTSRRCWRRCRQRPDAGDFRRGPGRRQRLSQPAIPHHRDRRRGDPDHPRGRRSAGASRSAI